MRSPNLLAIIPARLGSKSTNIRILGDKPLIHHTLEGAVKSKCFCKIMVTTDSSQIEIFLKVNGVEVPWLRPKIWQNHSHIMDSVFFNQKVSKTRRGLMVWHYYNLHLL